MGKGNMKLLAVVALVVLVGLSWYKIFDNAAAKQKEYDGHLAVAHEKAEARLFDDANDAYKQALGVYESIELREEIADYYRDTGKMDMYVGFCEQTLEMYPYNESPYFRLAEYYKDIKYYKECFKTLNKAKKRNIVSEQLSTLRSEIQYVYEYVEQDFVDVGAFSNGFSAVQRGTGEWALIGVNGKRKLGYQYLDIGVYNGTYLPVQTKEEEYILVDINGRIKSRDLSGKKITDCRYLVQGKMAVQYDGKYHYCDDQFNELFGSYDYASVCAAGRAAVMENGVWYVINDTGERINGVAYDDIKLDERDVAFRNNVAFAKANGKYILIDMDGNQVGTNEWDDVVAFNSEQPAAVSNGTLWGFVDASGNMVVDYKYENARSFSNGFAAVSVDGKWGFITSDDYEIKIDCVFDDAKDFNESGSVFVSTGNGWDMILLHSYGY